MAVIGILIAAAIIAAVNASGLPQQPYSTITSKVTSVVTSATTSTETYTSTKISVSNSTAPDGTMAVQIADLLSLPAGVTHVYVMYSDIEVHTYLANSSIWFRVAPENVVDLVSLSNNGVTVGITNIPSGNYDMARFTITSAIVTFDGQNLTAIVPATGVSVPIMKSGIDLLPNSTSGLLFDFAPSVVPTQAGNLTQIQLLPYAEALAIPTSVAPTQYDTFGDTIGLNSQPWFTSTEVNLADNVTVLAALVTNNALLVVLKNTGNATVTINGMALLEPESISNVETKTVVTTLTTVTTITEVVQNPSNATQASPARDPGKGTKTGKALQEVQTDNSTIPGYQTVASFLVLYNGEVVQPSTGVNAQQLGLVLSPGQNVSLAFIGRISTLDSLTSPNVPLQIIPGLQYLLQVQGPFSQFEDTNISAISPF